MACGGGAGDRVRAIHRLGVVVLLCAFVFPIGINISPAWADPPLPCDDSFLGCSTTEAGLDTRSTLQDWAHQPMFPGDDGKGIAIAAGSGPRFEYGSTAACTMAAPGSASADTMCTMALTACSDPARGT